MIQGPWVSMSMQYNRSRTFGNSFAMMDILGEALETSDRRKKCGVLELT
jgi:hypothetical protein